MGLFGWVIAVACTVFLIVLFGRIVVHLARQPSGSAPASSTKRSIIFFVLAGECLLCIALEVSVLDALRAARVIPETLPSALSLQLTILTAVLIIGSLMLMGIAILGLLYNNPDSSR